MRGHPAGGSARRRHAVGLSLKIWSAVAPIWRARRAAFSSPLRDPQVDPDPGRIGRPGETPARLASC